MIILDNINRSLQAVLSGVVATNEPMFVCSYADITATTFLPGNNDGQLNGTTPVTIMAAPAASTQRQLKYASVYNADTAPVTITLQYNDNSTLSTIFSITLAVGYRIEYSGEEGFKVYDNNGNLRSLSVTAANYYQTIQVNGTGQPQEGVLDFSSEFTNADDPSNNRSKISVNAIAESKVTNLTSDLASKLNLSGGTMTGALILNADPSTALGAATKQYVDNSVAGMNQKPTADVATTAALPANTYNNGSSGVGATLTGNSNGALTSVDSVAPYLNMIVLVKNEVTSANNGLYVLTQLGDASHPYILTRSTDMDASSKFDGAFIPVGTEGSVNFNTLWLMSYVSGFTTGTSAVTFVQINPTVYYQTIKNVSTTMTQRATIGFPEGYLVPTDDIGNHSTDIYIGDELEEAIITSMKLLTNN